jgi:hypothetical protein
MTVDANQPRRIGRPPGTGKIRPHQYPEIMRRLGYDPQTGARVAKGETQKALAAEYGVVQATIWWIKDRCLRELVDDEAAA